MSTRIPALFTLLTALVGFGCSSFEEVKDLTKAKEPEAPLPQPHDPNYLADEAAVGGGSALTPVAHSARTTLLEENEHLRDLLAKALADRRTCEQRYSESETRNGTQESKIKELEDSVARLSEELDIGRQKITALETAKAKLEKERSTLAEMYALEKRQRLAFEKELLEREIRTRSLTKDG